jgi:TatD DNase family protein
MPLIVDAHCHLDHKDFSEDIDQVIDRAIKAGLGHIITNGVEPETNRIALGLARRYAIVRPALGIYPIDAFRNEVAANEYPLKLEPFDVEEEIAFIEAHKDDIIAVGEAGLDYATGDKREEQRELFQKMIELAGRIDKPLVVHSRKAELDCVDMLDGSGLKRVMMHCFMGNFRLVRRIAEKGWYISIPTNVVRSEHFQKIVQEVDLSRLLTETDAPYLSPFRDRRNEPAFVVESVRKIAEIKQMDQKEVANNLFLNFQRLFL